MEKLMTVEELAEYLRTTPGTVYTWKSMGIIPSKCVKKIGRKLLFIVREIEEWVNSL
ncbi:MAG: helix-turn-helix domain-containing protein [Elusimicrobiaceae bacterium]|nr:helix-turn-helix domain-containing protein [Elusimicrobiaceae bacterium]